MNREQILQLRPGPELDALVAERITGCHEDPPPPYSEDISAVWPVAETLWPFWLERLSKDEWLCNGKVGQTAQDAICKASLLRPIGGVMPEVEK